MSGLADELEALAKHVGTLESGPDRANAKGRLALEVVANLPAILAALRQPTPDAGDMQGMVERLREVELYPDLIVRNRILEAVAAIQSLTAQLAAERAKVAELELNVAAQDALNVSAYRAGMWVGWNFCVNDNSAGYAAAMEGTEHVAELRRIRNARALIERIVAP